MAHSSARIDFYLTHRAGLLDYAASIIGERSGAEDVVQEAWIRFASVTDELTQPVAYLYRIVRNLALDHIRRDRSIEPVSDTAWQDKLIDQAPGPETHAVSHSELQRVSAALATLPARTRRAFELYRLQGKTLQEVADTLQISVGTAHQLVHAALRCCVESLAETR